MAHGLRTELVAGDGSPLLVKTASDDDGRETLTREADRLGRACHPGVVELLERSDNRLVLAWAGGETVETLRPTVRGAAALLAATAATVADLHEIGIVHGRLEARHVVVGPDGRPRLAGMAGRCPSEAEAAPADDVESLGRLIDLLIGPDAELEPIPERRWARPRWTGYQRRTLQTLADQATDDDPARRPTARGLAAAIADAVPDAALPSDVGDRWDTVGKLPEALASGPDTEAPSEPVGDPDVVDHPWPTIRPSMSEPPAPAPADPDPGTDLGRTDGLGTHPDPEPDPEPDAEPEPIAIPERAGDGVPDPHAVPAPDPEPAAKVDPGPEGDPEPTPYDPALLAGAGPSPSSDGSDDDPPTILGLRIDRLADEPEQPGGPYRPNRELGGPPKPSEPSRRARRTLVAGATVAVALVALTGWLRPGPADPTPDLHTAGEPTTRSVDPASAERVTDRTEADDGAAAEVAPVPAHCAPPISDTAADLTGDGCPEAYRIDGTTIETAGVSYLVGEADDVVAVGDWECEGAATPGVVRPTTGEVFLFDGWADDDEPVTVEAQYAVPGARSLVPDRGEDCHRPRVLLADGSVHELTDLDVAR